MDRFYPTTEAAKDLEDLLRISSETMKARESLNVQHVMNAEMDDLIVRENGYTSKSWVLCAPDIEDGTADEVVFRLQGVLTRNDLVPKNIQNCTDQKFKSLTQYIQICGIQAPAFTAAMARLTTIHQKFAQHLSSASFTPLIEVEGPTGLQFAASNRLFTSKLEAPTEQDNEFEYGLDPVGTLAKRKPEDLIHAPANMVKYFRLHTNKNSSDSRYIDAVPGMYKPGDIIELQISFVAIMTGAKKIKVTNWLQAVTLISDRYSKEAYAIRASAMSKPLPSVAIRRKIGYFYEDDEEARAYKKQGKNDHEMDP
ncbi:hypothetical protein DFH06DRAFT_1319543 [Mycena polygramma]|nr:hypothetical protein DFH06DRAFT_1319543 [Mycena polygramma]